MANDFDSFPLYDPIISKGTESLSPLWVEFFSFFYGNLTNYLSQVGIFVPLLTTTERDNITTPRNGQMIYNTTTDTFQGYQGGVWMTFTLT